MGTPLSATGTGQPSTAALGRGLAAAAVALSAATGPLADVSLDAAEAATLMGLLERAFRTVAYAQLVITRRAASVEVHRLDPVTAQQIDELVAAPEHLADGSTSIPVEVLRQGTAPHCNTQEFMRADLHISTSEARRRPTGGRLLVAPSPAEAYSQATPVEANYPILVRAASEASADIGNLAAIASRL
ncbi:MAG: HNH endonuclease, partial [Micrococcaceae bacterium]|nr:HNH endonuclease [Micrococcaceae bacterium]